MVRPVVVSLLTLVLGLSACPKGGGKPEPLPKPDGARTPSLAADDPARDRVEGTGYKNACQADTDCVASGCAGEVCAAEQVMTTCDVVTTPGHWGSCGCVGGECVWYRDSTTQQGGGAAQGMPCPDGHCAEGLTCMTYYGIAGPRGPAFTSCEIPCPLDTQKCPADQTCITISDGPGRVCRPR